MNNRDMLVGTGILAAVGLGAYLFLSRPKSEESEQEDDGQDEVRHLDPDYAVSMSQALERQRELVERNRSMVHHIEPDYAASMARSLERQRDIAASQRQPKEPDLEPEYWPVAELVRE